MSVEEFEGQACALELRVRWWDETLWLVPCSKHVDLLVRKGIGRGRIWTARELAGFLAAPGLTLADVENIARLKAKFGADILSVIPDAGKPGRG